jgi:hypothetical protein
MLENGDYVWFRRPGDGAEFVGYIRDIVHNVSTQTTNYVVHIEHYRYKNTFPRVWNNDVDDFMDFVFDPGKISYSSLEKTSYDSGPYPYGFAPEGSNSAS